MLYYAANTVGVVLVLVPFIATVCGKRCWECELTLPQLVETWGYTIEQHEIVAADGYKLNAMRIPHSHGSKLVNGRPVILQHGLLDSCAGWLLNQPNQSLGYILADLGMDVWLPNSRGNTYSVPECNRSNKACWSFSFDEMALYDVPAFVNYALNQTGYDQLAYIGHSQGATQLFAHLTTTKEIASKISIFIALAPALYIEFEASRLLAVLSDMHVDVIAKELGVTKFWPHTAFDTIVGEAFCSEKETSELVCDNVIFAAVGSNAKSYARMNSSRVALYTTHSPAGTSVQNVMHWMQEKHSHRFCKFDHGSEQNNNEAYGVPHPPSYDLSTMAHVPTAVFSGTIDVLADPMDIERMLSELPQQNIVSERRVDDFNHLGISSY